MDISKLKKRMVVKNYKELCELLGEPIKAGNTKNLQLKEWLRYFRFHKQRKRQSYQIDEIYETPLPKVTEKPGRKPIYQEHLAKILLTYLLSKKNHTDTMTAIRWYKTLGIVERRYEEASDAEIKSLSLIIDDFGIKSFYQTCNKKIRSTLVSVLNSLKKSRLIDYEELTYVKYKGCKNSSLATEGDLDSIEYAQNEALACVGAVNISELYKSGKFAEYNQIFKRLMVDLYGVTYVYRKFRITYLTGDVSALLSHDEVEDERFAVNHEIRKYIKTVAEDYQDKLMTDYYNSRLISSPENYAEGQDIITDYVMEITKRREPLYNWRDHMEEYAEGIDYSVANLSDDESKQEPVEWYCPPGVSLADATKEVTLYSIADFLVDELEPIIVGHHV